MSENNEQMQEVTKEETEAQTEAKDDKPKDKLANIITSEEVARHRDIKSGVWISVHGKVYDITKFLEEHPGGEEVLLEQAGQDSTESFEDVGHSTDARELMQDYLVGVLPKDEVIVQKERNPATWTNYKDTSESSSWSSWLLPVSLAFVASMIYKFYSS